MKNNPALPMPTLRHSDARDTAKDALPKARQGGRRTSRASISTRSCPVSRSRRCRPNAARADRGDRAVVDQAKDRSSDKPTPRPPRPSSPRHEAVDKAAQRRCGRSARKPADRFWLQAGSFSAEPDAENLKGALALAGWEATVQEGALPDKGVRYRVRLGPYDNTDELGRMKSELAKRGFDVAVIRY